ncbi:BON domain-containing protein [Phenylobacterium sp.]|uniref:BON domain-containing protein n=1 Tax=Phenylobacterium sp. TaxID=1871053 RepID=UPI002CE0AD9B|nr:BON domain-containing protein [Phenylobacterium sp.]HVI30918.1 BON domain-containing protein [Phenylobacterium sp.]
MPRDDWRERDDERRERYGRTRDRDDFGQADYSTDYGYDPRRRAGYRADEAASFRTDDYGQADYSSDYAYDEERGRAYRRFSEDDRDYGRRMDAGDYRRDDERREHERADGGRSWMERAGGFFGGRERSDERHARRRGPSDRVLWAVIVERLEDERRLDLRDVDVVVEDGEVTLNGTVRRKEDRRRIEDIADIDGVRHVQNNLRVRERDRGWTFI